MKILIVRLGALGDIVHTVPAAAALRRRFPDARIDWIADAKHAGFADLVQPVDRVIRLAGRSSGAWLLAIRELRAQRYDVAVDFQGLVKSALLARASGARRVIGFPVPDLRERTARLFYSEVEGPAGPVHVIRKNLRLLARLGADVERIEFPLASPPSPAADLVKREAGARPFALVNPGAAWPNKRWPASGFTEVCRFLRDTGMQPLVVWGPGERELAQAIVEDSRGAARLAPPTTVPDLLELARGAALMVSGDTGPLHVAAAAGAPVVGIFGPTDPLRNGPWSEHDRTVSRYAACGCRYERRCRRTSWCLDDVTVGEVIAAVEQRLTLPRA